MTTIGKALGEQITVTLDIGLDTVVANSVTYDNDGEYQGSDGVTLAHLVAERIADRLLDDARQAVQYAHVLDRINHEIDKAIADKLADILDREIVPTDAYGNKRGEPRTLTQEIIDKAQGWLTARSRSSGGYRDEGTNAERLITAAVDKAFTREVGAAIDKAKAEALAKTKDAAAEIFAARFASQS